VKHFDIPRTTLTTLSKNKDEMISQFLLSEYSRKYNTASGNPNQRKHLNLARLWH